MICFSLDFTGTAGSAYKPQKHGCQCGDCRCTCNSGDFSPNLSPANIKPCSVIPEQAWWAESTATISKGDQRMLCIFHRKMVPPWLLSSCKQPACFSVHHMDPMKSSGKGKGRGVCLLVNASWCTDVTVLANFCSPDLEHWSIWCCPFNLLREFTSIILLLVYVPQQANAKMALDDLYSVTNSHKQQTLMSCSIKLTSGSYSPKPISMTPAPCKVLTHWTTPPSLALFQSSWSSVNATYRDWSMMHYKKSYRAVDWSLGSTSHLKSIPSCLWHSNHGIKILCNLFNPHHV